MPDRLVQNSRLPFRKTISWKLIRVFALAVVLGSVAHLAAFLFFNQLFLDKQLQVANWGVAEEYARELSSLSSPAFQKEAIGEFLFKERLLNPTWDIYLLDAKGDTFFSSYRHVCNRTTLPFINTFLNSKGFPFFPIYGLDLNDCSWPDLDPVTPKKIPFSAAKIEIDGKPGYVYIVLRGDLYQEVYQTLGDFSLPLASIVFFVALAIVTIALVVLLSFSFARRFSTLTSVLSRFSEGDLETRVGDTNNDDLGLHAQIFDEMAQTIQDNIARLEESDTMRRQLVANVSHDLRTPVTAMQLLLETLEGRVGKSGDSEQLAFVERAVANCEDLRSLIDDLFELSKLDAQSESIHAGSVDLLSLLRQVVRNNISLAEEKDIAITLDCSREIPKLFADEKLLNRAVSNLLGNAIRYTQPGGEVKILAKLISPEEIKLSVVDNGPGISETDLPRIFDRFYRGSTDAESRGGTGLGLAIVKRIIELHETTISVESSEGAGTEFSFVLPVFKPSE